MCIKIGSINISINKASFIKKNNLLKELALKNNNNKKSLCGNHV